MVVAHGFYSVVGVWGGCFVVVVYIKFFGAGGVGLGAAYLGEVVTLVLFCVV